MKKGRFTLVQQYVINNLINNEHIVIGDILSAISTACSEEKLNDILSILISRIKYKEIKEIDETFSKLANVEGLTTQSIVEVSLEIPKTLCEINKRVELVQIIRSNTSLSLRDSKEFADLVRRVVTLKYSEVIKLREALKGYGIKVPIVRQLT